MLIRTTIYSNRDNIHDDWNHELTPQKKHAVMRMRFKICECVKNVSQKFTETSTLRTIRNSVYHLENTYNTVEELESMYLEMAHENC